MRSCSLINCRNHCVYAKRQMYFFYRLPNIILLYWTLYNVEIYYDRFYVSVCVCIVVDSNSPCIRWQRSLAEEGLCMESGK